MALDTDISLTTVEEVLAFLGADAKRDALWIYFDGTAGTATVEVQEDDLVLIDPDNVLTTIDMTVSTTLTTLRTAILNATGWKCGLIYAGAANSVDLLITGALDAEGEENEQVLKIQDQYLITQLINRASDLINRYCNRILVSSTYAREIYYGNGFNKLLLEQYPATQVNRLSVGRANCFSVQNTNTSATFATVEVTPDAIILTEDGTETSYTLATYATITLLLAAIVGGNWSCTLVDSSFGDIDLCYTTDNISNILVRPAMDCLTPGMVYVEIVDDDIADYKLLKPIEARNEGILYKPGVFGSGTEYFIDYQAGYTTIPYALEQACIELVAYKYGKSKRADSGDLQSETFGEGADYRYIKFNLADIKNILPPELLAQLDLFKKRSF